MTAARHFPPVQFLRECFRYEPATGLFWWRHRPVHHFVSEYGWLTWNARFAGRPAFAHKNNRGYPKTNLTYEGRAFQILAGRAAWAMTTGSHPKADIDHRNGDPDDTRFCNLREATKAQNNMNRRARTDKLKGAFFDIESGRYRSIITFQGKRKHLGYFDTELAAHIAYAAEAKTLAGDFARAA